MAAIVQFKQTADLIVDDVTLDDAPTDGNLIVVCLFGKGPSTPTMASPGYSLIDVVGAVDCCGNGAAMFVIAFYGKVVSGDDANVAREASSSQMLMSVWELSDADLDDITILSLGHQTGGGVDVLDLDLGTFTDATGVALMAAGATESSNQQVFTASITDWGDWNERHDSNPDSNKEFAIADFTASAEDVPATWEVTQTASPQGIQEWAGVAILFGGAPDARAGVFLDVDGDEAFNPDGDDNVSSFVMEWTIQRGAGAEITGSSQPGSATVRLQNPDDNFNPYNESGDYYGDLRDGMRIWIGPNVDGTLEGDEPRGLFGGRVTDITPVPAGGATDSPMVELQCEDMLGWARRTPVRLDYAEGRAHDVLRSAVLATAGETLYELAHEIHTMPLSHVDTDLLSALDDLNGATGTRHFAKPSDLYAQWFRYTTRNRFWRTDATTDASVSASADHVTDTDGWRFSADTVINRQKATVTPIAFTPGASTVWQAETLPVELTDASSYERIVSFDDVVRDQVLDIASTGDTVTAVFTPFAESAKIELSVAAGDEAVVSQLSVEGRLARRLLQESHEANDTASQDLPRGVRAAGELASEYIGVIATARGLAEHVVWRFGSPQLRPTMTVQNWLPEQFDLDLYDVIAFTSTQLKMDARLFEIVGLTHEGKNAATPGPILHTTTYVLQECRAQTDPGWFILDDSLLDGDDVLHY